MAFAWHGALSSAMNPSAHPCFLRALLPCVHTQVFMAATVPRTPAPTLGARAAPASPLQGTAAAAAAPQPAAPAEEFPALVPAPAGAPPLTSAAAAARPPAHQQQQQQRPVSAGPTPAGAPAAPSPPMWPALPANAATAAGSSSNSIAAAAGSSGAAGKSVAAANGSKAASNGAAGGGAGAQSPARRDAAPPAAAAAAAAAAPVDEVDFAFPGAAFSDCEEDAADRRPPPLAADVAPAAPGDAQASAGAPRAGGAEAEAAAAPLGGAEREAAPRVRSSEALLGTSPNTLTSVNYMSNAGDFNLYQVRRPVGALPCFPPAAVFAAAPPLSVLLPAASRQLLFSEAHRSQGVKSLLSAAMLLCCHADRCGGAGGGRPVGVPGPAVRALPAGALWVVRRLPRHRDGHRAGD